MWTNEWICMGKCVCKFVIAPYVQHIRFVTHTYWPLRARCAFATLDISSVFFFLSFAFYCCFSLLWFFFCAFSLFMRMMNRIFVPPASAITSFHKMVQFSFQCEWRKVKSLLCRRDNLLHVSNLLSRYGLCDIQPFIAQHQFHRFFLIEKLHFNHWKIYSTFCYFFVSVSFALSKWFSIFGSSIDGDNRNILGKANVCCQQKRFSEKLENVRQAQMRDIQNFEIL